MTPLSYTLKKSLFPLCKPLARWYMSRMHKFRWLDIEVVVLPGVFHPGLSPSTTCLANWLAGESLAGKKVLELGAGCGLLSIYAASMQAEVVAADISHKATVNLLTNAQLNDLPVQVIRSDMFDEIFYQFFDYILINPPCYPRDPVDEADMAYYCGANFEFFQKLFTQLPDHIYEASRVYMILPADCDIQSIRHIAAGCDFQMKALWEEKHWGEAFVIFEIKLDAHSYHRA
ncbi:MAG: methyltransferase [Bacteroidetes bacterium]|nr:MAG: methyltransferase [Bacteroidota bacterium]